MVMRYKNNYVDMLIHQQGQLGLVIYHPKFLKNSDGTVLILKFRYSEKATKFCEISTNCLSYARSPLKPIYLSWL